MAERFGALALPVGEFLALEHGTEFWGRADKEEIQVDLNPSYVSFLVTLDLCRTASVTYYPLASARYLSCELASVTWSAVGVPLGILGSFSCLPPGLPCRPTRRARVNPIDSLF